MYEALARELGFTDAVFMDGLALSCSEALRAYCDPAQCRNYGKTWVCPPGCGTLEVCRERVAGRRKGLLVRSVTELMPPTPQEVMQAHTAAHGDRLRKLMALLRPEHPGMLVLSYGGCSLCSPCSYPAPCARPDARTESLGAYGIDVGALCAQAGLPYSFREDRLYMTALLLF